MYHHTGARAYLKLFEADSSRCTVRSQTKYLKIQLKILWHTVPKVVGPNFCKINTLDTITRVRGPSLI